ncbi:MAG TPA: hypothetical protein VFO79_01035 [Xanthomonadales bacterium]|nr:hypothetical protein [Xanthomonadales bacterium]
MRPVVLLVLAACGRLGFDESTGDAPGSTAALCNPRTVGPLTLETTELPTVVRATPVTAGYAVAIETSHRNIHVARVTSTFTLASQHTPLAASYELGGIAALGDAVFVHALNTGVSYLKLLDASWNSYATVESGDDAVADPPIALRANGTGFRVGFFGGLAKIHEMRADGTQTGVASDLFVPAIAASIAPQAGGARVATGSSEGACETFVVGLDGRTSERHAPPGSCSLPRVAVLASGRGVLVYQSATELETIYFVPGFDPVIVAGSAARVAGIDDAAWVMLRRAGGVELHRVDESLAHQTVLLDEVTAPFDLLPTAAFWVDGATLRVGTPCLR